MIELVEMIAPSVKPNLFKQPLYTRRGLFLLPQRDNGCLHIKLNELL